MKRTAILVAALLLLPVAAGAQVDPVRRSANDWGSPYNGEHGISVSSSAGASIPATSAIVVLNLSSLDHSLSIDKETLAPIVDALVKAGADPASVQLPPHFIAPGRSNLASISATVQRPTTQLLQSGIVTVGTSVADQKNLLLNNATVILIAQHCADALDKVRTQALEHAREKAEAIAKDLGVHVGSVIHVQAFEQSWPDGSCQSQYSVNGFNGADNLPRSAQDYVTIPVVANVTITYAIK